MKVKLIYMAEPKEFIKEEWVEANDSRTLFYITSTAKPPEAPDSAQRIYIDRISSAVVMQDEIWLYVWPKAEEAAA